MYLETLTLSNFRSFADAAVTFQPHLTVLAGENNAGKTNVLDAIRLFTAPIDGRRNRYPEVEDIRRGATDFTLGMRFAALDVTQRASFLTALERVDADAARYGMRFRPPEGNNRRGRVDVWAGMEEGSEPEPDARRSIRHVHLPALRDAQRELASANPERIAFLLRQMAGGDEATLKAFGGKVSTAFSAVANDQLITDATKRVTDGLDLLTRGVQPHRAELRPSLLDLRQIARHLEFELHRTGFPAINLSESGLGYANLLFLATVLVELSAADEADLTLFLVEEPEAHLHPQLQAATLSYLRDRAEAAATRERTPGEPAGAIQVIVTTHSPNLASAVSSNHVVVVRSCGTAAPSKPQTSGIPAAGSQPPPAALDAGPPAASKAIAVAAMKLSPDVVSRIDRYLDVTRAALFFSPRVMLVEGIAESLLLPSIAHHCHARSLISDAEYARFKAATILAIDGVDFTPYVELLVTRCAGVRIADKVVVVTDGDPKTADDVPAGEERRQSLQALAATNGAPDAVAVFLSQVTLEADLLMAGNRALLRAVYLRSRPRSAVKFDAIPDEVTDPVAAGKALVEVLTDSRVRKGDLAQAIAAAIRNGDSFAPPQYLVHAVKALVE